MRRRKRTFLISMINSLRQRKNVTGVDMHGIRILAIVQLKMKNAILVTRRAIFGYV